MIRFNRMRGKKTLWLPGTDHAAIATQSKVEEILYKKDRQTLAIGGGVSANKEIRRAFQELIKNKFPDIQLFIPEQKLTTAAVRSYPMNVVFVYLLQ